MEPRTEKEVFWSNFRTFRKSVAGLPLSEVQSQAAAMRLGLLGVVAAMLPAVCAVNKMPLSIEKH